MWATYASSGRRWSAVAAVRALNPTLPTRRRRIVERRRRRRHLRRQGVLCGPGGRTHAPPRPPWAAVAALLALGSPHDPALDYTYLTLRMTLRYAALRYATLLLVAGCSSSPAAAARRSRPPRLRPSSSPASCACCLASRCPFLSRRLLRFCVFLLPPAPPAAAPPAHIPSKSRCHGTRTRGEPPNSDFGLHGSSDCSRGSIGSNYRQEEGGQRASWGGARPM